MDEIGRMHVMQCPCELVHYISFVLFFEQILADECVEVDVHKFEQDVDIALAGRPNHFSQFDDVGVVEAL